MGMLLRRSLRARPIGARETLDTAQRLSAASGLMASLEGLALLGSRHERHRLRDEWRHARHSFDRAPAPVRAVVAATGPIPTRVVLQSVRAAASIYLIAAPRNAPARNLVTLASSAITTALYPAQRLGSDGADQVTALSQALVGFAGFARPGPVRDALLWSQAIQGTMSYAVAGVAKLVGPDWRSERALLGIMRTHTYGSPVLWRRAKELPRTARAVSAGMLVFECAFPLAYLPVPWAPRIFLAGAVGFHAFNAAAMGLGRFLPSFMSLHPAIVYTSAANSRRPSAAFPLIAAAALAVTVGSFAAQSVIASERIRRRDAGRSTVPLQGGRQLVVDRQGEPRTGTVVLEGGLGTQIDEFETLRRALVDAGLLVVSYRRSDDGCPAGALLDARAAELAELLRAVDADVPSPPVVLGYSLGSEIVRRAVRDHDLPVAGVVALDPSHPGELARSAKKADTVAPITESMRVFRLATAARLGILLDAPSWIGVLDPSRRRDAVAEHRSARTWRRTWREWNAVRVSLVQQGPPEPSRVPVRVVSAGRTLRNDALQATLHTELTRTVTGDDHDVTIVPGVGHDDVIREPVAVNAVIEAVEALLPNQDGTPEEEMPWPRASAG